MTFLGLGCPILRYCGALVIGSLGNGLDLSGASAADKLMFSGAILLLAAAMDAVSRQGTNFSRGGGT